MDRALQKLEVDLWSMYPKIESFFEIFILCTKENCTNRGIGKKLLDLSFHKAAEINCDLIITKATNFISQAMFKKLGFETIKTVMDEEFKDENEIFAQKGAGDETDRMLVMIKFI